MENRLPPPMPEGVVIPETKKKVTLEFESLRQKRLKPFVPTEWVVENMLVEGNITVLVGDSGTGKSWKAAHISLCIAEGGMVDGVFPTEHGNVLWFDNENGTNENDRRCKALDREKLLPNLAMQGNDVYFRENHTTVDEAFLLELHGALAKYQPRLVIFDSLATMLPPGTDENDAVSMRAVLDALTEVLRYHQDGSPRERKPACLVLHHTKKGVDADNWPDFRGSSGVKDAVTFMLLMREIEFDGDEGEKVKLIQMKWRKARVGEKPSGIIQHNLKDYGVKNTPDFWVEYCAYGWLDKDKMMKFETAILACFKLPGEELTRSIIEERLGMGEIHHSKLDRAFKKLEEKKLLAQRKGGGKGNSKIYAKVS